MSIIDTKTDMVYGLSRRALDGQVFSEDGRQVVGWLHCDDCGEPVPVKLNKGGNPYYGCHQCNNQHRPQSSISREHFEGRMERFYLKGVKDDSSNENNSEKAAAPRETDGARAGDSTGSADTGKRTGGVRVGFFG